MGALPWEPGEVEQIARWACEPVDMRFTSVHVKRSRSGCGGTAYDEIPDRANVPPTVLYLVTIRLDPETAGDSASPFGGYPITASPTDEVFYARDWREDLVFIAAHEAAHIEQFRESVTRSERAADRVALRRVRAWRERNSNGSA